LISRTVLLAKQTKTGL